MWQENLTCRIVLPIFWQEVDRCVIIRATNFTTYLKMEWNTEKTINFIEDYHNSTELWDNTSISYKNNKIKQDRLHQLATKYECTILDLKHKIKNLRSAFHRERKRLEGKKSGSSPSQEKKWFAYDLLTFLADVDLPRSTFATTNDVEDSEVSSTFCLIKFI